MDASLAATRHDGVEGFDGEQVSVDAFFRFASARLRRLIRTLLRDYPRLREWIEVEDIFQNVMVRLLRALRQVGSVSETVFFRLATKHTRHELLDLTRHYYGPNGLGTRCIGSLSEGLLQIPLDALTTFDDDPVELEEYSAFHDAVDALPADQREVVRLIYYHGWSQAQVAARLHVTERTVQRRWHNAVHRLTHSLS